jgi:hypothetical protein
MDKQHRMETGHGDDDEEEDWDSISHQIPGRTAVQCLKRFMQIKDDKKDDDASDANASAAAAGGIDWSADDCELLKKLVEQSRDTAPRWNEIANNFSNHNAIDCLSKWQQLTQSPVIKGKGSWTPEEDQILREKRAIYGRKWAKIAAHLPGRQGKQCRERFVNHLDPALKKGEWSDDEEAILIAMHQQYGNRWANISDSLPGRSDNDVKNHWYSTIQRKFQTHGKEVSHCPRVDDMEHSYFLCPLCISRAFCFYFLSLETGPSCTATNGNASKHRHASSRSTSGSSSVAKWSLSPSDRHGRAWRLPNVSTGLCFREPPRTRSTSCRSTTDRRCSRRSWCGSCVYIPCTPTPTRSSSCCSHAASTRLLSLRTKPTNDNPTVAVCSAAKDTETVSQAEKTIVIFGQV